MLRLRLALVLVTACGGQTASPADAGRTDAASSDGHAALVPDACPWSDAIPEDAASGDDAGCIGGDASGIACPCAQSLASYCNGCPPLYPWSRFSACDSSWQSVTANPPCDVDTELPAGSCAGYDILGFSMADSAAILLYDASSGRLIAVLHSSTEGLFCSAGPAFLSVDLGGCVFPGTQALNCAGAGQ